MSPPGSARREGHPGWRSGSPPGSAYRTGSTLQGAPRRLTPRQAAAAVPLAAVLPACPSALRGHTTGSAGGCPAVRRTWRVLYWLIGQHHSTGGAGAASPPGPLGTTAVRVATTPETGPKA